MSMDLTRIALQTRTDLKQQSNIEFSSAATNPTYLTLTRTTQQTIATSGTIIIWGSEVRASGGITWSGSQITIPSDGYYAIDVTWAYTTGAITVTSIFVNSVKVARMTIYYGTGRANRANAMRYFTSGDIIEIEQSPVTGRVMTVNAYDGSEESPFLHIVKIA